MKHQNEFGKYRVTVIHPDGYQIPSQLVEGKLSTVKEWIKKNYPVSRFGNRWTVSIQLQNIDQETGSMTYSNTEPEPVVSRPVIRWKRKRKQNQGSDQSASDERSAAVRESEPVEA